MSGHKRATISISQDEYQRLKDAEIQIKTMPAVSNESQELMVRQLRTALEQNMGWLSARQDRFANLFDGYQTDIVRMQDDTNRLIHQKNEQTRAELTSAMGTLWRNTGQVISQVVDDLQAQYNTMQTWLAQEIATVQDRVDWIVADQYTRTSIAGQWLDAAQSLLQAIAEEYHHDEFAPGQVDRLASRLILASQNLQSNLPESALSMAQQVFLDANDLRVSLELAETEWLVNYQAVTEYAYHLQGEILAGEAVQAMDLDGNPLPYALDPDYWTAGKWSDTVDYFLYTMEQFGQPEEFPSIEYLTHMLHEYLPGVRSALTGLVYETRISALNSQLRINIADLVVQALNEQGYQLNDSTYLKEDWRDSYYAQLSSLDGSQVIVQVDPVGNEVGENSLHLVSSDGDTRSERELVQRWNEVAQSLSAQGLHVEGYQVARGSTRRNGQSVQGSLVQENRVHVNGRNNE